MSYSFRFQPELNLVVVVFTGVVPPEEEADAFKTVIGDDRLNPNSKFLVDRSASEMRVSTEDVQPHIHLIRRHQDRLGKPRMALVAGRGYDFGMARMLEMQADDIVDHDFCVFRSTDEACNWLGIERAKVAWPEAE